MGAKGSLRDIKVIYFEQSGHEIILAAGCDRHIRLFDADSESQKLAGLGSAYLKQKINSILLTNKEDW